MTNEQLYSLRNLRNALNEAEELELLDGDASSDIFLSILNEAGLEYDAYQDAVEQI